MNALNKTPFQSIVRKNNIYLQKDCIDMCLDEKVKKVCNCSIELSQCLRHVKFSCVLHLGNTQDHYMRENEVSSEFKNDISRIAVYYSD